MIFENAKDIQAPQGRIKQIKNSQGNILWSVVPEEFRLCQYIQSSGTQYIDTGIKLNYSSAKITQVATAQYMASNANRELMGANGWGFWGKSASNKLEAAAASTITESALVKNTISLTTVPGSRSIVFSVNSKKYTGTASSFPDNNYACYVFAIGGKDGAAALFFCNARVYEYIISFNDEVVSHLLPAKRLSDGEPGMYDIVARKFLVNAGTGTFVIGQEL